MMKLQLRELLGGEVPHWVVSAARRPGLVPVDTWGSLGATMRRQGELRTWADDAMIDSTASCAVFTQLWLSEAEATQEIQATSAVGVGVFTRGSAGPIPNVHGGAIATLLDNFLSRAALLFNGTPGATTSLEVRYRAPVPLRREGTAVLMEAKVDKVHNQRVSVSGKLSGDSGQVFATATGLFVAPDPEAPKASMPTQPVLRPWTVAIGPPPPAVSADGTRSPRTATGAAMIAERGPEQSRWVLENERLEPVAAAAAYAAHGIGQYIKGSPRLRQDCLWQASTLSFVVVYAFSRQCRSSVGTRDGMVDNGCLFAALDDAVTRLLFSRAATDLGAQGGLMLTASMRVDHKATVPLDREYCVDVRLDASKTTLDKKGRRRYTVTAALSAATTTPLGGGDAVLTVGTAEFVETDRPWPGQILPTASAAL